MVKKFLLAIAFILCLPVVAWAADFTATVDSNVVTAGQPFTLQLSLSGVNAKAPPDISPLTRQFSIVGQAQTSSYNYINGTMSSDVGVQLSLVAREEGHVTIPALSIETSQGTLSTQPIEIDVRKGAPQATGGDGSPVSITATADPQDPYQDQPVRYQILVTCFGSVTNIVLDDITVENAVLEKPSQPKIMDVTPNGRAAKMLEYDFVLTPLKPGRIVIPPPSFHGATVGSLHMPDPLNAGFGSFVQMLQGMGTHPFDVTGPEVDLDIKPPAADMHPWLPLTSLKIQDEWRGVQDARMGEPVTRKITLYAEGLAGSQLPNLEADQNHADFKVYADKPSVGTNNGKPGEHIMGWRRESYTLIPQKPGTLTLPAIRVPWWDVGNGHIAYADIPEKTIDVVPGIAPASPPPAAPPAVAPVRPEATAPAAAQTTTEAGGHSRVPYIIIGILVIVLLPVVLWALSMQKKISSLQQAAARPKPAVLAQTPRPVNSDELSKVQTPDELRRYLQALAASRWGTSANAPLEKILSAAPAAVKKDLEGVVKSLTAALYAARTVDMEILKRQVENIRGWKPQKTSESKPAAKLQDLNPH